VNITFNILDGERLQILNFKIINPDDSTKKEINRERERERERERDVSVVTIILLLGGYLGVKCLDAL